MCGCAYTQVLRSSIYDSPGPRARGQTMPPTTWQGAGKTLLKHVILLSMHCLPHQPVVMQTCFHPCWTTPRTQQNTYSSLYCDCLCPTSPRFIILLFYSRYTIIHSPYKCLSLIGLILCIILLSFNFYSSPSELQKLILYILSISPLKSGSPAIKRN